jgi:DNA polymerase IV
MIRRLAEHTWSASRKESRIARTVAVKLKASEFKILTPSHTPMTPPASYEELTSIALALRERVGLAAEQRFRLVGVGLTNFFEPDDLAQPLLFSRRALASPTTCRFIPALSEWPVIRSESPDIS